jgi:hypothetical protein
MIIWGGVTFADNRFSELRTGGRYNPTTNTWTPTRTRSDHLRRDGWRAGCPF